MKNKPSLAARCSRGPLTILLASLVLVFAPTLDEARAQTEPLNFAGDFRVRFEGTTKQEPSAQPGSRDPRYREVVRFRFGMNKKVNGLFNFGARLATGSPDDPNTTDITLGDFVNDLTISLDRVFMELKYQNLFLTGGKFANPFRTTELVWDGDVNPQGVGVSYTFSGSPSFIPKLTGVYFIIDEQTVNDDSYMLGGQMEVALRPGPNLNLTLAGGYYDYSIKSLINANAGDIQSNYLTANGKGYLSDFDLINAIAILEYRGFGERFPIRLIGDYVKNRGAAVEEDAGFGADIYVGKAVKKRDWRLQYGYSRLETDAALAAFTHDNTTFSSNYEQHTLALDYVVVENTVLTATLYHFRRDQFIPTAGPDGNENEFYTRLRLNVLVNF